MNDSINTSGSLNPDEKPIGISYQERIHRLDKYNKHDEICQAELTIQHERDNPYTETPDYSDNPDDMPVPHPDDVYTSLNEGNTVSYSYIDENGQPQYYEPTSIPELKTKGARRLSGVKEGEMQWLWPDFIPRSELIALSGNGGVGKTTLMLNIIADITRGRNGMPLGNVVYLTKESNISTSIIPKLISMGADMDRVLDLGDDEPLTSLDDPRLISLIEEQRPLMVIFDPITSFVESENSGSKVRKELTMLRGLAEKYNCTIININHMSKSGKGAYKVKGSVEFVNVPRIVLRAGNDPNDLTRYALTVSKTNIGEQGKSKGYKFGKGGSFHWTGPSDLTQEMMDSSPSRAKHGTSNRGDSSDDAVKLEEAKEFLYRVLTPGTRIETKELTAMAETEEGIKEGTLIRARKLVGVKYDYEGFGVNKKTYCSLPDASVEQSE